MEINLKAMADFEVSNAGAAHTLNLMNSAICAFLNTPEVDIENLEPLFPIYRDLEKLGIVSDIPELEEVDEDGEEEGSGNDEDDD